MDDNWQNPEFDDRRQWAPPSVDRPANLDDVDLSRDDHDQRSDGPGGERPLAGSIDAAVMLDELERAQSQLWAALRSEDDPDIRMALLSRLSENRSAILALGHQWGFDTGQPQGRAARPKAVRSQWNPVPGPDDPGGRPPGSHPAPFGRAEGEVQASPVFSAGRPPTDPPSSNGTSSTGQPSPDGTFPDGSFSDGPWSDAWSPAMAPMAASAPPPPTAASVPGRPLSPGLSSATLADQLKVNFKRLSTATGVRREPFSNQRIAILAGAVLSVLGVAWLVSARHFGQGQETTAGATAADSTPSTAVSRATEIATVLAKMGLGNVTVDQQDTVVHLGGTVASEAERNTALGVVGAMVDGWGTVASDLTVTGTAAPQGATPAPAPARAVAMQNEMNRLLAATPLIFDTGQTALTELHVRILNNMAIILKAYPEVPVTIIGYTDNVGSNDANNGLSRVRAEGVKAYLVAQGMPPAGLVTKGEGEAASTGSQALASLERRVDFQAVIPIVLPPAAAPGKRQLKVAMVAPSARNDLAFTQSMVEAVNTVAAERGSVQVDITDSTFVPAEAAAAIRRYADASYDLIIAHGVEFGPELVNIVKAHPRVVFAWGTASDTFGLPNLYAYDAAAEEGGYIEGAMASMLSTKGVVGVVGPIQVADAQRYISGFKAGALAEKPTISVPVTYTGSFSDVPLATEAAKAHIAAGADVLTGTAEMVVGAVSVAHNSKVLWFGTQANQASMAPDVVVASQVYHWEVLLRPIMADVDAGTPNGRPLVAKLDNGGLVIEYNPAHPLAPPVRARADELVGQIKAGVVKPPTAG